MKTIIAGSRDVTEEEFWEAIDELPTEVYISITEIVSGGARGADKFGEQVAKNLSKPVKQFIPDWDGLGKKAGILRNIEMGDYADQAVVIWDGESRGSAQMIKYMEKLNKPVYVIKYKDLK
ncbi:DNA recombination-mediator protein A [Aeromonas phage BUCT695]|uniref:DNA recombination-mediator protein A n=1 Tax=Aeromonas phage BUCT695 TaxID=2908630 RepID=UPI0023293D30|nr:DNA recombination-mediator protein A [Aeromonas phage BUCT695]UIW10576.1 DNA recombination-mediator protein A [Aeromonas phage BUCT695]